MSARTRHRGVTSGRRGRPARAAVDRPVPGRDTCATCATRSSTASSCPGCAAGAVGERRRCCPGSRPRTAGIRRTSSAAPWSSRSRAWGCAGSRRSWADPRRPSGSGPGGSARWPPTSPRPCSQPRSGSAGRALTCRPPPDPEPPPRPMRSRLPGLGATAPSGSGVWRPSSPAGPGSLPCAAHDDPAA